MSGDQTRRSFLKQSSAAALAAPALIAARSLRASAQDDTAPSDRITLGFIGVGKQNLGHLKSFTRRKTVQIVAVCDVDTTRRENARKTVEDRYSESQKGQYKGCEAYSDYRELLARDDIDAVVIATPDHWHAIPVIDACKAGKDIYCEKPLSLTIREAKLMLDAVRKYKRVFQTGSQQRTEYDGKFRKACEYVRSGRIGKLIAVHVGVGTSSKWCDLPEESMEPGLDWDRWLGPAPKRPYNSVLSPRGVHDHFPNWRAYREYSGGSMTDFGAHHFDIAQWGLDMDESGPVEIHPPQDDKAMKGARFVYANGVEMFHGGPSGITFVGTEGYIYVDRGKLTSMPEKILEQPLSDSDVHLPKAAGHHQNWLECIKSREKPIADVEIGARSVTVCHLGNLAYWYRQRMKWDPAAWKFRDSAGNDDWLDRERRDPWQLPTF